MPKMIKLINLKKKKTKKIIKKENKKQEEKNIQKEVISIERKEYLKNTKRKKRAIKVTQISILVLFIGLWELLARFNIIDSFITSKPSDILTTFIELAQKDLWLHIGVTSLETIIGFLLGAFIGVVVAIILWWSNFISKVSQPFLVVLNSLPKVALGPIIIVWVGAGMPAIVVMALAISLIVTILEMLNGFKHTDKNLIKMAKTFNSSKWQILTKIILPSNVSTFFNSLKVNMGLSLVGVITGEFLVSKAGLGYLIVYGGQVFQLGLVMTGVIILALMAALMYQIIVIIEKITLKKMAGKI